MTEAHLRPSWDEYFMGITDAVALRATCDRGRCGTVIIKDKRILATGYVGSPAGTKHCDEVGHEMHKVVSEDGGESQHCIRTAHAEQNAIVHAARAGVALEGGTLYTKMVPCYACAKMIINAGIVRVVAKKDYHASKRTKEIFKEAGVTLDIMESGLETYDRM